MLKKGLLIACLSGFVSTSAQAVLQEWEFKPHLGMDVFARYQDFESDFGEDHFRAHYPDVNFYLGTVFHKYLGLEGGYEHSFRQERKRFYWENQPVLGFQNVQNPSQSAYLSEMFVQGWHLNLLGLWPICPKLRTELTAQIGLAWLKMHYNTLPIFDNNAATPVHQWESDNRAIFRWGLGVRQMVTDNFGLRLQFVWENTSKLDATTVAPIDHGGNPSPTTQADNYTAKPENSHKVGLGFFFKIG